MRERHGHTSYAMGRESRTYKSWCAMLSRCTRETDPQYREYGGRGIKVCARWMLFDNFLEDMGKRPRLHTLERIDNDRGYDPSNCRWATAADQARNRRNTKLSMVAVAVIRHMIRRGALQADVAWAFGVTQSTVSLIAARRMWK